MNDGIKSFIKKAKKNHKVSILKKYKEEIFLMRNEGLSFKTIAIFLKEKGVKTSLSNLSQWYKREQKKDNEK